MNLESSSGRSIPDFMAVWDPFIFGTLRKPAEHPIIAPPGKTGYGIDWNSTSIIVVIPWEVVTNNRSLQRIQTFVQPKIKFLKKLSIQTSVTSSVYVHIIINYRYLNISILVQKGDLLLKHQGVDNIILISFDRELFCKRACFRTWNGFRIGFEISLGSL